MDTNESSRKALQVNDVLRITQAYVNTVQCNSDEDINLRDNLAAINFVDLIKWANEPESFRPYPIVVDGRTLNAGQVVVAGILDVLAQQIQEGARSGNSDEDASNVILEAIGAAMSIGILFGMDLSNMLREIKEREAMSN